MKSYIQLNRGHNSHNIFPKCINTKQKEKQQRERLLLALPPHFGKNALRPANEEEHFAGKKVIKTILTILKLSLKWKHWFSADFTPYTLKLFLSNALWIEMWIWLTFFLWLPFLAYSRFACIWWIRWRSNICRKF